MEINQYIKDLLFSHDRVIIPNLGAFVVKYHSAAIQSQDDGKASLLPPRKELLFDGDIVSDDGLLTGYLVEHGKVSKENAESLIATYVKEAWDKLKKGQSVALDEIGFLSIRTDKKIAFTPDQHSNFLIETFGLTPIETKKLNKTAVKTEKAKKEKKRRPALIAAIIIIILLLLLIPAYFFLFKDQADQWWAQLTQKEPIAQNTQEKDNTPDETVLRLDPDSLYIEEGDDWENVGTEDNTPPENNTDNNADNSATNNANNNTTKPENNNNTQTPPANNNTSTANKGQVNVTTANKTKYYVIVGSYRTVNNARRASRQFTKANYEVLILTKQSNNRYRLAVGGDFTNKAEADRFKRKLAASGVWTLTPEKQ